MSSDTQTTQVNGHPTLPPEALELASRLFDMARHNDPILLSYVSQGIPPNLTNSTGDTLLMLASYHGHSTLVKGLLDLGADPNLLNGGGQSPMSGAIFKNHIEVVRALVSHAADPTIGLPDSIQTAGMFGRADCCEILGVTLEQARRRVPEGIVIGPHGSI